jgi:hypothetical protein
MHSPGNAGVADSHPLLGNRIHRRHLPEKLPKLLCRRQTPGYAAGAQLHELNCLDRRGSRNLYCKANSGGNGLRERRTRDGGVWNLRQDEPAGQASHPHCGKGVLEFEPLSRGAQSLESLR